MEEKQLSPDSAVGPMLCNQKKDKICLVCGDKALGYNFNAVSCESCKAFFRRNAHKTIRGRCEGKCDVNIESRSFCKRCRLAKCYAVGMRKDMILDDNQKKLRKQKILINKLRRHGTLPPEDTYAVSDSDSQTVSTALASQSKESLREQFPNLSDSDIQTLHGIWKSDEEKKTEDLETDKKSNVKPWHDCQENLDDIVSKMDDLEKTVFLEVNRAHEQSSFLANTQTRLKNQPKSSTDVFNIADGFVRRIIKVAKQLSYFRSLDKDDQIALLKGSVVEIMMLRSAVNFNIKTESWSLSTSNCLKQSTGDEPESNVSSPGCSKNFPMLPAGLDIRRLREAAMKGADINELRNMAMQSSKEEPSVQRLPEVSSGVNTKLQVPADRNKIPGLPPGINAETLKQKYGLSIDQMKSRMGVKEEQSESNDIDGLRNAAKAAGFDVDALKRAAMNGASLEQLSQLAHSSRAGSSQQMPLGMQIKEETSESAEGTSISSDILKFGNPETKSMFSTYVRFIKSLVLTIHGDLMILKLLIMLSLHSSDRPGIQNPNVVERYQELYANTLKKYVSITYPEEKNMFARCIMMLTDIRNMNEVHTRMLLKMQVEEIEPLLVEIFDLPQ